MADNTLLNTGTGGDTIATDDIGGIKYPRSKIVIGADGTNDGDVSSANPLPSHDFNVISTDNSTTTPLGISGNYTGTGEDVSQCSTVSIIIDSSHDSATDGMTFEFSTDDTNWDEVHLHTYIAADGSRHFQLPVIAQYFRVNYTNGGTGQTTFRVQTILHSQYIGTTIHRLGDSVDPDRSSTVTKSVILAQAAGSGDFVPVQATAAGNFKVDVDEIGGVAPSLNTGVRDAGTQRVTVATDDLVPISAASLPLPAGAATSAAQLPDGHNVTVDNASIAITAAALPLPSGAATSAAQLADGHGVAAAGDIAHDAPDSGNPVKTGGKAKAFDGTPAGADVAEDDRVDSYHTPDGRQYVETAHPNYFSASVDYATAQTNATVQAAPGASLKNYITDIIISNGATAGNITLLDGSGGSVLLELYPAVNGGLTISLRTPIAQTANTLLAITSTTVTTHTVTICGFVAA